MTKPNAKPPSGSDAPWASIAASSANAYSASPGKPPASTSAPSDAFPLYPLPGEAGVAFYTRAGVRVDMPRYDSVRIVREDAVAGEAAYIAQWEGLLPDVELDDDGYYDNPTRRAVLLDARGHVVSDEYASISPIPGNRFLAYAVGEGRTTVLDARGRGILPAADTVLVLSDARGYVACWDSVTTFYDASGVELRTVPYALAHWDDEEDYTGQAVWLNNDVRNGPSTYAMYGVTGERVTDFAYDDVILHDTTYDEADALLTVYPVRRGDDWGLLQPDGRLVVPIAYEDILPYVVDEDRTITDTTRFELVLDGMSGICDASGRMLLPMADGYVMRFGPFLVREVGDRYRVYDVEGKRLTAPIAAEGDWPFSYDTDELGIARLWIGERYRDREWIGLDGVRHVEPPLQVRRAFGNGNRIVDVGYAMGLMDARGEWIAPFGGYVQLVEDFATPYIVIHYDRHERAYGIDGTPYAGPYENGGRVHDLFLARQGLSEGLVDANGDWVVRRTRFDGLLD